MSDPTIARSAIPPLTAVAWAGKDGIYCQFPTKEGTPYVSRFPKTASGLQSALNLLLENPMPKELNLTQPGHPAVKKYQYKVEASANLRAAAAEAVAKLLKK